MQLKNNNPVPMEKRTDLPSLFCMIGRHGPAVAVAVIAMVSVMAGFIIYRSVKGKRRKADPEPGAGDVGGSNHGALRDASLQPEPSPEHEARSRVESTDVSDEVSNARDGAVIRSRRKPRQCHATVEKNPQSSSLPKEVEPEKLSNASHVEETSDITQTDVEEAIKSLQDNTCEVRDLNVEDEGLKCNLVERPNNAEEVHSDYLEPVVVCESLGNEEKVQRSQKDEVTMEAMSTEMPCKDEENLCAFNSPIYHEDNALMSLNGNNKLNDQATSDSVTEGYFEEPSVHTHESLLSTKNEDISVLDIGLNKPHPANEDLENVALRKHVDDQLMTVSGTGIDGADADLSPNSESKLVKIENELPNLGELPANCTVLLSSKELEPEQDAPTYCTENVEDVKQASCNEPQETSVLVFSTALPHLSVEPETIHYENQPLPLVGLQPEDKIKYEITSELAEATSDLLDLACPQREVDETVNDQIPKENVEIILSSANCEPDVVVSDKVSSATSMSTEISCPDNSSFQNQESEERPDTNLLVAPTAPTPGMAENMEPQLSEDQLFYENSRNLTWWSPDVGLESGISSMTVNPDLPDAECPLTSEHMLLVVLDVHPQSEHQAQLKTTMADSQSVIKEPADAIPDLSNDSQPHIDKTNDDSCTVSEMCHEIESFNSTVGQLAKEAPTDFCLNKDLGKMGTEIGIKGKHEGEDKEDKTTEINIMEATMENNEWITDGTDQVLPWMKPSVLQINPVSIEHPSSFPVDAACTNADVPPVHESEEANMVPPTDEATETGKRVLAVQPMPQNVSVTFRIHYLTHSPYQKVAITGNHWELGNWKDFVSLEKAKDGFWAAVVNLPVESHVEWKFVVVDRGEVCRWEECGNRLLDTGNRENLLVHKCWGLL
ncbi:uncharacterized protein stbd1 [Anableps anableps]